MPDLKDSEAGPLLGVVLCSTAVPPEQRTEFGLVARQLGAAHNLDLTSETTHLLVGHIDTPKYRFVARERRDIKVLRPEWLDAVRKSWMEGGETNVAALEEQYKLPAFSGLSICITGFEDLPQRLSIMRAIEENGAKYHGDLTRIVSHLVCAQPQGKKYDYAEQWGVKRISVEWIRDSLKRGMALDETCYNPLLVPEERGKGAVNFQKRASPMLKRKLDANAAGTPADVSRRKLRRTASAKFEAQDSSIWAEIAPADESSIHAEGNDWDDSISLSQRRRASGSLSAIDGKVEATTSGQSEALRVADHRLFSGHSFWFSRAFHPKQSRILYDVIQDKGGLVVADDAMQARLSGSSSESLQVVIIVPHDMSNSESNREINAWRMPKDLVRTHLWLESCLAQKILCLVPNPLYEPLPVFPIPGFEHITICPTSFVGMDLLHFSKVVKLIGAVYDEACTKKTSVIVGHRGIPNLEKLRYALNHGIPVVSVDWFLECIRQGQLLPVQDYFPPAYAVEYARRKGLSAEHTQSASATDLDLLESLGPRKSSVSVSGTTLTKPAPSPVRLKQPLRELEPTLNSPPKCAIPTSPKKQLAPDGSEVGLPEFSINTKVNSVEETDAPAKTALNLALLHLLEQRKVMDRTASDSQGSLLRRQRKLGRAASNPLATNGQSFIRISSQSLRESEDACSEAEKGSLMGHSINPSQSLSYEDSEVLAARQKLTKKLGKGQWEDEDVQGGATRVERIGQVQDTVAGERGGRRKARKGKGI